MKKIFSIAKIVLLLLFRSGAGWGFISLSAILAGFMFYSTNSDNILVNELSLRIKYSLFASTILINIALIYFACISLRKDIDDRRFHTISAAPVHRAEIWLGKFFGITALGLIVFLTTSAVIALSCVIFIANWDQQSDISKFHDKLYRTYYACTPNLSSLEKAINVEYEKRLKVLAKEHNQEDAEADHDHDEMEGEKWHAKKYLLEEVRKEKQIITPEGKGEWIFNVDQASIKSDFILLQFKFYTNTRRKKISGEWCLASQDGSPQWKQSFSGYPFIMHEIKIPKKLLPETKQLNLVFQNKDSSYVIFPVYHGGLKLLYDSGGIFKNYLLLTFFSLLYMAVLVSLALTLSSIFSYSVAVFVSISIYVTGLFSGFFANIIRDLSFHDESLARYLFTSIIHAGLWLTENTKVPPVTEMFSDGLSIPAMAIISSRWIGFIIYIMVVIVIGIRMLTKKEIDKVLQA